MEGAEVRNDLDQDGLDDTLEEEVLRRFRPRFLVSSEDCDGLPAKFESDSTVPRAVTSDGTIYGQVFPVSPPGTSGFLIEVHYYHLWKRDCGDFGHELDTEVISTLLHSDRLDAPSTEWRSVYWYAAAHEGTLCDSSNAARSEDIGAQSRGAAVWISAGKHASFLSVELCERVGCGGDRCEQMQLAPERELINVGELGSPMNGADWIASEAWPLSEKMETHFGLALLMRFESSESDQVFFTEEPLPTTKPLLLAGNKTYGALGVGSHYTGVALRTAGTHTDRAVGRAFKEAGRSFLGTLRAVGSFLGLSGKKADPEAQGREEPE
ncbi:MAG: hypothetical protein JSU96_12945 [Acidobacteriota bacterium]|nr:MAG: hypothetical protein JSU96_12945 [Acidobacteriota bacterium]